MQAPMARASEPVDPRDVLSSIGEVVYIWDIGSDELRWGPNIGELMGPVAEALTTGLSFAKLVEPGAGRSRYDAIMESGDGDPCEGVPYRTRYALLVGDRKVWTEDTGRWFGGIDGAPAVARGVLRLERAVVPGDLAAPSTSVTDRFTLIQRLDELMSEQVSARRPLVALVAAIDGLGRLNDDFGHEATDQIMMAVQERLRSVMRGRDRLVRYSGNRFAIIMTGCPPTEIENAARRFLKAVSQTPVETPRGIALVRLRIGAAHAPEQARQSKTLLAAAEAALTQARQAAPESIVVAGRGIPAAAGGHDISTDQEALAALNERRIRLARQPVVFARDRKLAFHEALARIERRDGSHFAPGDLIPALERRGLVRLFDHRVLELAVAGLRAEPGTRLSLNVSPQSLIDTVWIDAFEAFAAADPELMGRLVIELTETAAIAHPAESSRAIARLKDCGARIAIDDFGAGHTSLRHLRDFPVDILKLDGAFTQNLGRSTDDRFFVRTLLELAGHLGVETVAEWVDNEEAARMLTEWGVTYLQGHLVGAAEPWLPELSAPQARAAG